MRAATRADRMVHRAAFGRFWYDEANL